MDKILVTRPLQDFARTAEAIEVLGFEAMAAPMMNFETKPFAATDLAEFSGLIFTSANGVRALADFAEFKQLACYAVGDASAKAAQDMGFELFAKGAGDVGSLCDVIAEDYLARGLKKPLLHISGVHRAGNLSAKLAELSIAVQRIQAYEMVENRLISEQVMRLILAKEIAGLLFYSTRSAQIFIKNIRKMELLAQIRQIPTFCLSKNIADAACRPYLEHIHFVNQPDEAALLDLMQQKLNLFR